MNRPLQAASQPAASPYLDRGTAIAVFLAFAAAYFCSALVRSITATLAPVLTQEFSLQARDLGLLGGGYFLGFAAMQLPLGSWLDRFGPKQVLLCFLSLAVVGCLAFSLATGFAGLLAARVLIGMGVSACMMAALTGYRRWFEAPLLLRANSWMLMTGSLGMLASTLPVQWLMPLLGWRPLFWILAGLIALSMLVIGLTVPAQEPRAPRGKSVVAAAASPSGYRQIWRSGYFRRMSPLAFFNYGGLIAIQTLWAGPWMVRVAGYTPFEAATGLFFINAAMLVTFWTWGLLNPVLAHRGWSADRLVKWGIPFSLVVLAANIFAGPDAGWPGWAIFCVASSVMGLAQPAVGMAFPPALAGRALSGYNLVIFSGVFVVQWGLGLLIDLFRASGFSDVLSFQSAFGVFFASCVAAYVYFLRNPSTAAMFGVDNQGP
ncbi:MAG: MFS transporter [Polaromonas sp.]|nr:MFS transporter [Polaromonas sp.]